MRLFDSTRLPAWQCVPPIDDVHISNYEVTSYFCINDQGAETKVPWVELIMKHLCS